MKYLGKILLLFFSTSFSLLFMEIGYRLYFYGQISEPTVSRENQFWQYDRRLGWANIPNSQGFFSNYIAGYNGWVSIDRYGLRKNDNNIQFTVSPKKMLIVGDSTTAGFEVDNSETYTAILERLLNSNGKSFKLYNAGVRGYGADQALWTIERYSRIIKFDYILYMFTGNDLKENRTIKKVGRVFGKPVFVYKNRQIDMIGYPVPKYEENFFSYVEYYEDSYRITSGYLIDTSTSFTKGFRKIKQYISLRRPIKDVYLSFNPSLKKKEEDANGWHDVDIMNLILSKMKNINNNLFVTYFTNSSSSSTPEQIKEPCKQLKINLIDLSKYFTDKSNSYHWKMDGHWNRKGHEQAAKALYKQLLPIL